jgi:glycosyltransferase involved in cell wall biosynthesis
LLYVGRISKEKDLVVIAKAWPELRREGAALAFVGEGPYRAELEILLPEAAFTGVLTGLELATAFASAEVFLFPSTTDTFGNVILESLASGVPCVVSDFGGPKDLITDGQTGFISKALDSGDFAEKVRRLLDDESLRSKMRETARAGVEDRDWTEAGRKFWAEA